MDLRHERVSYWRCRFRVHERCTVGVFLNSLVIKQKGESQNGSSKKTKHAKFSEKRIFFTLFLTLFGVLCFLITSVLRFALLSSYWRIAFALSRYWDSLESRVTASSPVPMGIKNMSNFFLSLGNTLKIFTKSVRRYCNVAWSFFCPALFQVEILDESLVLMVKTCGQMQRYFNLIPLFKIKNITNKTTEI